MPNFVGFYQRTQQPFYLLNAPSIPEHFQYSGEEIVLRETFRQDYEFNAIVENYTAINWSQAMPITTRNRQFREVQEARALEQRTAAQLARTRLAAEHGVERAQRQLEEQELRQAEARFTDNFLREQEQLRRLDHQYISEPIRLTPEQAYGVPGINREGFAVRLGEQNYRINPADVEREMAFREGNEARAFGRSVQEYNQAQVATGNVGGFRGYIHYEEAGTFNTELLHERLATMPIPAQPVTMWTGEQGMRDFEAAIERTVEAAGDTRIGSGIDGHEVHYIRHESPLQFQKMKMADWWKVEDKEEQWAPEPDAPLIDLGF